ncbi:hypothetical protein MHBO_000303 [Bonamia ostreae]|uniref:G-patch domain-containing protein n=1 Tax=Bonamia ostreae TaxID=126728 RepID=A0ABV2AF55_9EUKA
MSSDDSSDLELLQKKKKRRNKDEAIYGVLAADILGGNDFKKNYKNVKFTAGKRLKEEDFEKPEIFARSAKTANSNNFADSNANNATPTKNMPRFDKDFNRFSNHTTGFGMKMLKKFGFKGRLGKHETGRVNPIIPKIRSAKKGNMSRPGLNFGGIDQRPKLEKIDKLSVEEDDFDWNKERLWLKGRMKSKIYSYKEVLELKKDMKKVDRVMFDYTKSQKGERVELKKSFGGFNDSGLVPELRFNLKKTLENIELSILKNEEDKTRINTIIDFLENKLRQSRLNEKNYTEKQKSLIDFEVKIELAQKRYETIRQSSKLDFEAFSNYLSIFEKIESEFRFFYETFGVATVVFNHSFELLTDYFQREWMPFKFRTLTIMQPKKSNEVILRIFETLKNLLHYKKPKLNVLFDRLIERLIGSKLRFFVTKEWNVLDENNKMVDFLTEFKNALPSEFYDQLIANFITPKLVQLVSSWNFEGNKDSLKELVSPWTKIGSKESTEILIEYTANSISLEMDKWLPYNEESFEILLEFSELIPDKVRSIVEEKIMPKIEYSVSSLQIDKLSQEIDVVEFISKWQDLIPVDKIVDIFENDFFPKWISALFHLLKKLKNDRNGAVELIEWYQTWKKALPPVALKRKRFAENMFLALQMMHCFALKMELPDFDQLMLEHSKNVKLIDYKSVETENTRKHQKFAKKVFRGVDSKGFERENFSFKEIVQTFAQEHDMEFYPYPNKLFDGKQIFLFGKKQIYLNNNCAYLKISDSWRPVSLDQLI